MVRRPEQLAQHRRRLKRTNGRYDPVGNYEEASLFRSRFIQQGVIDEDKYATVEHKQQMFRDTVPMQMFTSSTYALKS